MLLPDITILPYVRPLHPGTAVDVAVGVNVIVGVEVLVDVTGVTRVVFMGVNVANCPLLVAVLVGVLVGVLVAIGVLERAIAVKVAGGIVATGVPPPPPPLPEPPEDGASISRMPRIVRALDEVRVLLGIGMSLTKAI